MVHLQVSDRLHELATDFLRKYGDGRSEAHDDLVQLLAAERATARDDGYRLAAEKVSDFSRALTETVESRRRTREYASSRKRDG